MRKIKKTIFPLLYFLPAALFAADHPVTNLTQLNTAIAGVANNDSITFLNDISLSSGILVRPLNSNNNFTSNGFTLTINGGNHQLTTTGDGQPSPPPYAIAQKRGQGGFFARGGTVIINDLIFNNLVRSGGNAGQGCGGGGAGLGGGLFIAQGANVTLSSCQFEIVFASGGLGSPPTSGGNGGGGGGGMTALGFGGDSLIAATSSRTTSGGGGGYGGNGGKASVNTGATAGGGGGGAGFPGHNASNTVGGSGGGDFAGTNGGSPNSNGGSGGGGGGGDGSGGGSGGIGGFGGGGGGSGAVNGGNGGFGGGGGGCAIGTNLAGNGGFGGGGGGWGDSSSSGGNGGFGGGGGGHPTGTGPGGTGGFLAGNGNGSGTSEPGGGCGAGMGGAIFIQNGGSLTIADSFSFTNCQAVGGGKGFLPITFSQHGQNDGNNIFMMSGASITFNLTSDGSLPSIRGDQGAGGGSLTAGGLTKMGPAKLTLTGVDNPSGASNYTGTTTIAAGELNTNSDLFSEIIVQNGGTLSGIFTAHHLASNPNSGNLTNGGLVSPGTNGVGQINLEGNFTNQASGTLLVDITPTGNVNDKLFLTMGGTASLDGTLELVLNNGNYIVGTTYLVINAPVAGTFANVVKTGSMADTVEVQVSYSSVIVTILNQILFAHQIIDPGVPSIVATAIKNGEIIPGSDFAHVVEVLGTLSTSALNRALFDLSAANYGALDLIGERNNSYIASLLSKHLVELCCSPRDCCSCDNRSSAWATGFGNLMNNYERFDNLKPYGADAWGLIGGFDYCFPSSYYLGASIGYIGTDVHWKRHRGHGHIYSYYGALYGSYKGNYLAVDLSLLGGGSTQRIQRHIVFSTIDRIAKGRPWQGFAMAHAGIRTNFSFCGTCFEPFALCDYHYDHRSGFREKGAMSIDLVTQSHNEQIIRGEAGLLVSRTYTGECSCFSPYVGLSWVGEFPLEPSREKSHFIGQTPIMNIRSFYGSIQLGSPQAGMKWTYGSGFSFDLGYKGLFNSKTSINEVEARLEWVF